MRNDLEQALPELLETEELIEQWGKDALVSCEAMVEVGTHRLPIYSISIGPRERHHPVLMISAGVHGLERVGTVIANSYLATLRALLSWDRSLQDLMSRCRIVVMPLVNPGGMLLSRRSNPRGVDLMRNAPVNAERAPNIALVGGHRLSRHLPWYRGPIGDAMEVEARALVTVVEREILPSSFAIAIDMHSGFGLSDRVWFPYAGSKRPFSHLAEVVALKTCLDRSLPLHDYQVEPQSIRYITHGDLWDYLLLIHKAQSSGVFLPLCLEMGSWLWVKKNPRQLLSPPGLYNPILPHRLTRTIRRHMALLDFLLHATDSRANWLSDDPQTKEGMRREGLRLWHKGIA